MSMEMSMESMEIITMAVDKHAATKNYEVLWIYTLCRSSSLTPLFPPMLCRPLLNWLKQQWIKNLVLLGIVWLVRALDLKLLTKQRIWCTCTMGVLGSWHINVNRCWWFPLSLSRISWLLYDIMMTIPPLTSPLQFQPSLGWIGLLLCILRCFKKTKATYYSG